MVKIEQFDNEIIKIVNRQIELGTNYSIDQIVKTALTNMSNGNFTGITRSAQPFFRAIDTKKVLEELMGCEFSSALYIYSKRIDSFYKSNNLTSRLEKQVGGMNELKQIIDSLGTSMETTDLANVLKQAYLNNDSVSSLIEEGYEFMLREGNTLGYDDLDNKINVFISYIVGNYYTNFVNDQYKLGVKETAKNIDNNLSMLQILPYDKIILLTDLYCGNYNDNLGNLQNNVEKTDVIISLLRNAVQTSLVSTNVIETSSNERILYENAQDMENTLMPTRRIISKLLGQDINSGIITLSAEQLSFNLKNLSYEDIKFLSWLYMETRRDEKCIRIVENSSRQSNTIVNLNQNQYANDNSLLKLIESKEFKEELSKQYHI